MIKVEGMVSIRESGNGIWWGAESWVGLIFSLSTGAAPFLRFSSPAALWAPPETLINSLFAPTSQSFILLLVTTIPSLVRLLPEILHIHPNCKYDHNKFKPASLGCLSIAYGESLHFLLWQRSLLFTVPGCGYNLLFPARVSLSGLYPLTSIYLRSPSTFWTQGKSHLLYDIFLDLLPRIHYCMQFCSDPLIYISRTLANAISLKVGIVRYSLLYFWYLGTD